MAPHYGGGFAGPGGAGMKFRSAFGKVARRGQRRLEGRELGDPGRWLGAVGGRYGGAGDLGHPGGGR